MKFLFSAALIIFSLIFTANNASALSPEEAYKFLSQKIIQENDSKLIVSLNTSSKNLKWGSAEQKDIVGNLRFFKIKNSTGNQDSDFLYFIRSSSGDLIILSFPSKNTYSTADMLKMTENKLRFPLKMIKGSIDGNEFQFGQMTDKPGQILFDKIFKISIVAMLFLVMMGMGLSLKFADFSLVFKKPRGIFIGLILQYGVMPLVAFAIGSMLGYIEKYPYIYLGLILIAASPAGVTSNLLTHYAKGDLALSISLTSISTLLSLASIPVLLSLYGTMISNVSVPAALIAQTIIVLVIVPLIVGMGIRMKWEEAALKAAKFFSALGIVTVLFIMIAGVISNFEALKDTNRYNFQFYAVPLLLTFIGMALGILISKVLNVSNYQIRSVAFETSIRNSALAMTLALLIQDQIGDFYSSMFIVSGIYGLEMYIIGMLGIMFFKKAFLLEDDKQK